MNATWAKEKDLDYHHTAATVYKTDGYRIWKGQYRVFSVIYSANEWHLEREADHRIIWSAKTAKECMENFEYASSLYMKTADRLTWYETWNNRERRWYWWSSRDDRGRCFEIWKSENALKLYSGEREVYLSSHSTLQGAMDAAENF